MTTRPGRLVYPGRRPGGDQDRYAPAELAPRQGPPWPGGAPVALWVVPREAIHAIEEFPDEFDLKYRRVDGYSIKARLKEARERAGTAAG